jgi:hypothetical protein
MEILLLRAGRTKHRSKRRERRQKRRFHKERGKGIRMTIYNEANAFSRLPNSTIFCPNTPLLQREPNDPHKPPLRFWQDHLPIHDFSGKARIPFAA